ncbi:hypothetical protein [Mucilaginibacter sp.]|nr:hypothetical protein [Mucilaginibacter sp.]
MNQEIIKDALYSALTLLKDEVESVIIPELSEEYYRVIDKIEIALKEI